MLVFDKNDIKNNITLDDIYNFLQEWGGEPEYTPFGILSTTICHNLPGEGSRKLYYYDNSGLFKCYTGCADSIFDIFELVIKVMSNQHHLIYDLNDAIRWVAQKLGISGRLEDAPSEEELADWKYLANYNRIADITLNNNEVLLKEYDKEILSRFNYVVKINPWLSEGITQDSLDNAIIGYYPGGDQITIPHFDIDGRFIGLRGRTMCVDEAETYGKYRPLKINKQLYNHPLGMNLYNLNHSKENIRLMKKAIVFESEKSCLKYQSYFGLENDISVACCGSSISAYQIQLLINSGAEEIVVAFDRQFEEIGNNEFNKLKNNLLKLRSKYKNFVVISFIFDKNMILDYKASPIDEGPEKFLKLFKERIVL